MTERRRGPIGSTRLRSTGAERVAAAVLAIGLGLAMGLAPGAERGRSVSLVPGAPVVVTDLGPSSAAALLAPVSEFAPTAPGEIGLDPSRVAEAVRSVEREVRRGAFPGAALAAGRGDRLAVLEGIGRLEWGGAPVAPTQTRYDLASLTKVVATTTAVMLLVEDGKMALDAPVARYIPEFRGGGKERVTIRHLLAHTSGLPAGSGIGSREPGEALRRVLATPLRAPPGQTTVYSDLGPVVLWAAAERAAGESPADLLQRRVFGPLGMSFTGFTPDLPCVECAPTTPRFRGVVHDPTAQKLGGVTGNAGLFGTASDIGRFAAMMANGGVFDGVRVFEEETVREFTRRQPGAQGRALGWDTRTVGRGGNAVAFGHTGFTGTSLWIDPARGTWTVLLTNRVYEPRQPNRIQALRRSVQDQITAAAE